MTLLVQTWMSTCLAQYNSDTQILRPEKLRILTDRDIYIAGETVFFTISNLSDSTLWELDWSKIVYVEIITPDGVALQQGKFHFGKEGSAGKVDIPNGLQSGNYYIRAYTKWMRNFSPTTYGYKNITIVNPFSNELIVNQSTQESEFTINNQPNSSKYSSDIYLSKKVYNQRERVFVQLKENHNFSNGVYSVSVVKKGLIKNNQLINRRNSIDPLTNIEFFPETRGISLSGKVVNEIDTSAIKYSFVFLTLFNNNTINMGAICDESGNYVFHLPDGHTDIELFINASIKEYNQNPVILVDNDYCKKNVILPFIPFKPDNEERKLITEQSINVQLKEQFFITLSCSTQYNSKTETDTENRYFYGDADYQIILDKFIKLPGLKDYFDELIPSVIVRQKNKQQFFKVLGNSQDLNIYEPLVLVDMVAISNANKILEIDPQKIESIEVVQQPYIKGNITYGGIIHLISKDKDFAGVDLPSSGQFFKFNMLDSTIIHNNVLPPYDKHIPDVRNCLYWNAMMEIFSGQPIGFNFYTGDIKGEFMVFLRGFEKDGSPIRYYTSFFVE
jgi:hypothetical protein